METTVTVHGLKELSEALKQMPEKLAGKALGASVAAGAGLVREAVKANAVRVFKDPTGATEKSIVAYRGRGSRPTDIHYMVGVTMKKKWPRRVTHVSFLRRKATRVDVMQPAFWWKFVEFGTVKAPAKPYYRPAWDASSGAALVMIKKMLEKAVVIAAEQVPKYGGR